MEERIEFKYFQDEKEDKVSQRLLLSLIFIVLVVFAMLFITNMFFQQNYRFITINGTSMQPTLNPDPEYVDGKAIQDGVFIRITKDVTYNDIVIVDKTDATSRTVIKRVMAMGGDYISIIKVKQADGSESFRFIRLKKGEKTPEILEEDYILGYEYWDLFKYVEEDGVKYEDIFYENFIQNKPTKIIKVNGQDVKFSYIEEGYIFYMGDNRTGSFDARSTGADPQTKVIGKVVSIVHDATSSKALVGSANKVIQYLKIVWNEISNYFAWNV